MKCIVTGAAGFIGSHLTDLLLSNGHTVWGVDDFSSGNDKNISLAKKNNNFYLIRKSVNDVSLKDIPSNVDWIFHLAGKADLVPSIQDPENYFKVNVEGTLSMLQLARATNVKKFIYCASSTCYGIPKEYPTKENINCVVEHPYGLTKMMGEELTLHWNKVYNLPCISLRLFNVYGVRSRTSGVYGAVFGVFLKQKLANTPFTVVGDGTQTRDFTYVTDVANAFLKAADSNVSGEIFNVGSGNTYSINKLTSLLKGQKIYIPKRPGEPNVTFADISKIKNILHWEPKITLEVGVQKMLDNIQDWNLAPLWTKENIEEATKDWFKYLNKKK